MSEEFISMALDANKDASGLADIPMLLFICGYHCYCGIFHAEDMSTMLNTANR